MFGYIVPYMPELKGSDHELYQAYYCGLCRSLGKYGLGSKMTLTYDATFALALLTAVTGEKTELEPRGCAAHPVRGRIPTARPNAVSDYCAAVCVLLARYKLIDDARDGRPVRRAALPVIHRGVKAAERKYPEAAETLSSGLAVLGELEERRECDADAAPMLFGELLGKLLICCPGLTEAQKPILMELGRRLGGFIYVMDAWDDMEEDKKRKSYNIFNLAGLGEDAARAMMDMYINSAQLAYDLLDLTGGKTLLDNIMYLGLAAKAAEVLKDTDEEPPECPLEDAPAAGEQAPDDTHDPAGEKEEDA